MKNWLLGAVLALAGCAGLQPPSADERVTQLMDQAWQQRLARSPQMAAQFGDRAALAMLDDHSPAALAQAYQADLALLARARQVDAATLSEQGQVNLAILTGILENRTDGYRFHEHLMPLTAEGGFHNEVAAIATGLTLSDTWEAEAYLARLAALPTLFQQQIHWMREGMRLGYTQPKVVLSGFESSIEAYLPDNADDSLYYRPFTTLPETLADTPALRAAGLKAVREQVLPAYRDYLAFFVNEYRPAARTSIAAAALPEGGEYYANRVNHFITLAMTPDQVHRLGLEEVARIRTEMESIIRALEFDGSFADFLAYLRTDSRFYADTPEQLLRQAAWLAKQADAMLPRFFGKLPRTPYGVMAVPAEIAPKYTTGRYSGPGGEHQPGYYWVNTYALDKRPLYALPALTLHEAVPGHHLQIALTRELGEVHPLRRYHYISAFGEGWGLYAEKLGVEGDYYEDAYADFGRLSYEMWRACRLVVDTGIHAKGWSRQQAIDFMADNTALSLHNVTTEVDRYISWPGQALSYKMGELTLWRLRHEAEQALGERFDLRGFHDTVLANGSVPLAQLERQVRRWTARQRG
ncbi:DUF885 domain-containing protein [Ferrimonas sediminicola]|uniref:DUF885 domain-containing protein n=1 Tax=Ferrimonas sediminicola TaxID=2569538 RepID=A0A4U1BHX2_9GAMM|nr:DUF885 domain-containing protein [Ferrimonas sediminicola]TKB51046.1 DUF885 domain-containing protein [Ferrimonas sediminicola]